MNESQKLIVEGKEYQIDLRRFDEAIDKENSADYHGYYVNIAGNGANVTARKYDDEDSMSIQKGLEADDTGLIEDIRRIAQELFQTNKLELLTQDNRRPYRSI